MRVRAGDHPKGRARVAEEEPARRAGDDVGDEALREVGAILERPTRHAIFEAAQVEPPDPVELRADVASVAHDLDPRAAADGAGGILDRGGPLEPGAGFDPLDRDLVFGIGVARARVARERRLPRLTRRPPGDLLETRDRRVLGAEGGIEERRPEARAELCALEMPGRLSLACGGHRGAALRPSYGGRARRARAIRSGSSCRSNALQSRPRRRSRRVQRRNFRYSKRDRHAQKGCRNGGGILVGALVVAIEKSVQLIL